MEITDFSPQNEYTYEKYKKMCNRFADMKLIGLSKLKVNLLLSDYIFCLAMKRIDTNPARIIRRFMAAMLTSSLQIEEHGREDIALVFTGDGDMRPDYILCLNKVSNVYGNAVCFKIDRKHYKFSIKNFLLIPFILIWVIQINKVVKNGFISLDMAVFIFRSVRTSKKILREMEEKQCRKLVTFCDQWCVDNALTQLAREKGYKTATLQHGNGQEIFAGFCSDWYLCNSALSRDGAVKCGIPKEKLYITGPMKYAGDFYRYKENVSWNKIGIVFDGLDNKKNNLTMLGMAHKISEQFGLTCYIRFHPSNNRTEYEEYLWKNDIVSEDLAEFETVPDIYLVYISTMYTDLVYRKRPVFRYDNKTPNLFSNMNDMHFSDVDELRELFLTATKDFDSFLEKQKKIFTQIYGKYDELHSYEEFFKFWNSEGEMK